jgi:hypothetical protein
LQGASKSYFEATWRLVFLEKNTRSRIQAYSGMQIVKALLINDAHAEMSPKTSTKELESLLEESMDSEELQSSMNSYQQDCREVVWASRTAAIVDTMIDEEHSCRTWQRCSF